MVKGAGLGEVELFAWARGCGAWRLGRVAEVPEDLAHGDWVCDLCDEAAWTAAVRTGQDVEGEDGERMAKETPKNDTEVLPGTLDLLVLRTLQGGALHGFAIAREIQRRSGEVLAVEEGSLYPALHRIERQGWIEAEWGLSESNRKARFYSLTRAGRAELKRRTEQWERVSGAVARVLAPEVAG